MKSVVLFSGGLDSFATLHLAREASEVVSLIHIDYGQRHAGTEQHAASILANRAGLRLRFLSAPGLASRQGDVVLGRNLVLLTLAANEASDLGASEVWTGFCQADVASFPDCRPEFVNAAELALRLALGWPQFRIVTPLIEVPKAGVFRILKDRGLLEQAIEDTATCYQNNHYTRHPWGYGCGTCNACVTRADGFANA